MVTTVKSYAIFFFLIEEKIDSGIWSRTGRDNAPELSNYSARGIQGGRCDASTSSRQLSILKIARVRVCLPTIPVNETPRRNQKIRAPNSPKNLPASFPITLLLKGSRPSLRRRESLSVTTLLLEIPDGTGGMAISHWGVALSLPPPPQIFRLSTPPATGAWAVVAPPRFIFNHVESQQSRFPSRCANNLDAPWASA